jgi:hypothetical protein
MNLSVLLLFTEHVQNVCYEDSQEESKTPQIRIHWKVYPGENQTCELPNFGRMRKTGELTKSFLQSQSSRTPPPPNPTLFGTLHQKCGLLISWNWSWLAFYCWKRQAAGTPTELNWVQARCIKTDHELHLSSLYSVTDCTQFSWGTSSCIHTTQYYVKLRN